MSERECPLCHEILGHDAPEATIPAARESAPGWGPLTRGPEWVAHPMAAEPVLRPYRIVWATEPEASATVTLSWPRLLYALRQYVPYTTRRLSTFVARVERVR